MPYSVTSWFVQQAAEEHPQVKRVLTIGGSDYSDFVMKWPSIARAWNDIRPVSVTISLANDEQTFNFFKSDKTKLRAEVRLKIGFTHPTSGDELISPFIGRAEKAVFVDGKCDITVTDKLKQLADRVIGSSKVPVTFNNSSTPADIAWYAVTSYGGYSSVRSTSNPDIDYQSWLDWAAVFSADTVYMAAQFDGQRVLETLRKIGRHTQSAIFLKEDKLAFFRFTTVATDTTNLNADHIKSTRLSIEDTDMVNKQWVHAEYVPASDFWNISCFDVKSSSVNSFGLREHVERDEQIWYVNSSSALNLAQRFVRVAGEPFERLEVKTILAPLHRLIGETIQVYDAHLGITEGWRIMRYALDLSNGEINLQIDGTQINTPFILDVSALDGSDVLI